MGPSILNLGSATQGYLGALILIGQARKLVFNSLTPLFVYGNQALKFLVDFVLILITSRFGTKPMVSSPLFYN